jgi:hypothetical protein
MSARQVNDIEGTLLLVQDIPYEYLFLLALSLVAVVSEAHSCITSL